MWAGGMGYDAIAAQGAPVALGQRSSERLKVWDASAFQNIALQPLFRFTWFCNNTSMQLFVKGNGSPFSLTVAGSDTIEDVKMKVAKVAGISAAEQQLI
jgi:hypothetical protein